MSQPGDGRSAEGGSPPCRHPLDPVVEVMATLRAPGGCPWDREQTHASLARYLVEEAGEVLEAIDDGDDEALCEELGDLLLQVVFHAQIASERGAFTIDEVVKGLAEKLIRRHPHVFGGEEAPDAAAVLARWEALKQAERPQQAAGPRLPRNLSALLLAEKALRQGEEAGWPLPGDGWPQGDAAARTPRVVSALQAVESAVEGRDLGAAEVAWGDLLLALVALGRQWGLDSESALRHAVRRWFLAATQGPTTVPPRPPSTP